ncbi:MAG: trigger factor [Mediterranea sp.]|jgi:trigger factor|nr:trigger factor [Mediterranea sp.]
MNVSLENIDKVSALLTVKVEKADYQEKVEKSLKTLRQKVQMPGFRPGHVPAGLVKKMYGKSATAEEVNKILQDAVFNYIKENKVNILGEPLPNEEKQQTIDFDTMEEFEFMFDIALAPEFKVEVGAKDKVDYYNIEVTDEMVNEQVNMYTQRSGNYEQVDAYQDGDMLKGILSQLDDEGNVREGGIVVEGAVLMPKYMKSDEQKALFEGSKLNDTLVFNPHTAYDGHESELASLLKISKDIARDVKTDFSFQIGEITRYVPGELTQEVFDQAFGEGVVKSEEEFRAKVKENLAERFVPESDYRFLVDMRKLALEKVGKLEFADKLLKRIMLQNNEEKGEEYVAENYDKSIEELTWHLIKEQLVEQNGIKVEQDDVIGIARNTVRTQYAQYGMTNLPDELIDNAAQDMLKKRENVDNMVNRAVEMKLSAALKKQVKLTQKTVTIEEFNKLFD